MMCSPELAFIGLADTPVTPRHLQHCFCFTFTYLPLPIRRERALKYDRLLNAPVRGHKSGSCNQYTVRVRTSATYSLLAKMV